MAKEKPPALDVKTLRQPPRHHPAQSAAQGVAASSRARISTIRSRARKRRLRTCPASSRPGCWSRPTGFRRPTPRSSRMDLPTAAARSFSAPPMTSRATPRRSDILAAAAVAESLCRVIEHAPDLDKVPSEPDPASHQGRSGDRARSHQARQHDGGGRVEPAPAQGGGRLSDAGQSRPSRAPRGDHGAQHRAGRLKRTPSSSAETSERARLVIADVASVTRSHGHRGCARCSHSRNADTVSRRDQVVRCVGDRIVRSPIRRRTCAPRRAPTRSQSDAAGSGAARRLRDRSRNGSARARPCADAAVPRLRACRQSRSRDRHRARCGKRQRSIPAGRRAAAARSGWPHRARAAAPRRAAAAGRTVPPARH